MSASRTAQAGTEAYIRAVAAGSTSPTQDIARAKGLLDDGVIDQRDYEDLMAKVLA